MPCPKCGGPLEIMVDVTMLIPENMENNITKHQLRRRDVKLYAAGWPKASYFCLNTDCRWSMSNRRSKKGDE